MNNFWVESHWLQGLQRSETSYLQNLAPNLYQNANGIVWIRLDNYQYPSRALYLPEKYRKLALCEAHNHHFGGHNAALKIYIWLTPSYCWPKIYSDVLKHTKNMPTVPTTKEVHGQSATPPDQPNVRVHAILFSPMLAAGHQYEYILCIMDASQNMHWLHLSKTRKQKLSPRPFFQYGFINSVSQCKFTWMVGRSLLINSLKVIYITQCSTYKHTKTTPEYPQCNVQVEVLNKTVSYHTTIMTTLFELLIGTKP
jgi:hypothetical protein